jgi:hypothetical protein
MADGPCTLYLEHELHAGPSHCRYNHSGVTALRFEADYSGLMHFTTAECVVDVEVVEDKIIEVPDNSTKANSTEAETSEEGAAAKSEEEKSEKEGEKEGADKDAEESETGEGPRNLLNNLNSNLNPYSAWQSGESDHFVV